MKARLSLSATLSIAFVGASFAAFGVAFGLGALVHVSALSLDLRCGIAASGFLFLAMLDFAAVKNRIYCPLGLSRQTPRILIRKYPAWLTAGIWGFDTGLVVTTFRVAAITWGALFVAFLGLCDPLIGTAYAAGFLLPLMVNLWIPRLIAWSFIQDLLKMRPIAQISSALLLVAGGFALMFQALI